MHLSENSTKEVKKQIRQNIDDNFHFYNVRRQIQSF